LYSNYEYTFLDSQRTKDMQFVQKYLHMKHVIVFKLGHDVLQVALDLSSPPPPPQESRPSPAPSHSLPTLHLLYLFRLRQRHALQDRESSVSSLETQVKSLQEELVKVKEERNTFGMSVAMLLGGYSSCEMSVIYTTFAL
jgi:hypothetical protein